MKTRRTLKPGQPGTKKLVKEFGDRLLCVRYRYDAAKNRRLKTAEIILEETYWSQDSGHNVLLTVVNIRVNYEEKDIIRKVKNAGGVWVKEQKVWQLPFGVVIELRLADRIVL